MDLISRSRGTCLASSLLLLAGVAVCSAEDGRFRYLKDGQLSSVGDYQGVALGDATGEVFLYLSSENAQGSLYRWRAGAAEEVPLPSLSVTGSEAGAGWADFDGDGDLDLYVSRYELPGLLYINDENRGFNEDGRNRGLAGSGPGQGVSWIDFDLDGDLDLYVAQFGYPNVLYENRGESQFVEVAATVGIADDGLSTSGAWGDYDADGDLDVYVVNHRQADRLYRNVDGRFSDRGSAFGLDDDGAGIGAGWVDWDSDGDLDLSLTRYGETDQLYDNNGRAEGRRFDDIGPRVRLDDRGQGQMTLWGDYDLDGDVDAYVVNGGDGKDISRLYRQDRDSFRNVSSATGLVGRTTGAARQAKGAVWWDTDADGDLDLFLVNRGVGTGIYRNDGLGEGRHWFSVAAHSESGSNRNAIGSRLTVHHGGTSTVHTVGLQSSFLSQGSQRVFIGLGDAEVDSVVMTWPHDPYEIVRRPPSDQHYEVWRRGPVAEVTPETIEFYAVAAGQTSQQQLRLHNTGESTLRVDAVSILPPGAGEFDVALPEARDVAPGESVQIEVGFAPGEEAKYSATLVLDIADAGIQVPLRGEGVRGAVLRIRPGNIIVIDPIMRQARVRLETAGSGKIRITNCEIVDDLKSKNQEKRFRINVNPRNRELPPSREIIISAEPSGDSYHGFLVVDYEPGGKRALVQVSYPGRNAVVAASLRGRGSTGSQFLTWVAESPWTPIAVAGTGVLGFFVASGKASDELTAFEGSRINKSALSHRTSVRNWRLTKWGFAGMAVWGGAWYGIDKYASRGNLSIESTRWYMAVAPGRVFLNVVQSR